MEIDYAAIARRPEQNVWVQPDHFPPGLGNRLRRYGEDRRVLGNALRGDPQQAFVLDLQFAVPNDPDEFPEADEADGQGIVLDFQIREVRNDFPFAIRADPNEVLQWEAPFRARPRGRFEDLDRIRGQEELRVLVRQRKELEPEWAREEEQVAD